MHPGFGIPGIQHYQKEQQLNSMMENLENSSSMNQTPYNNSNINVEQIHNLLPHHLFMADHNNSHHHHHHHFLPISHNHYMEAAGASSSVYYPPVNFKLGLNEINCSNTKERDCSSINGDGGGAGNLVHGSEQYEVPTEVQHTCLEMHHCWHKPQQDSSIKQPPFWETLPSEVSNENSEIIDRLDQNIKMNLKQHPQSCSNSKTRLVYGEGELESIYKRCGTSTHDEVLPRGQEQGSEDASIEASVCLKDDKHEKKKKKKKRKERSTSSNELVQFFEKLVKHVVDHQENLHTKFAERMERLDGERREKEEAWRSRELVYFEQAVQARAREKALAATREDAIVSYLEKTTGEKINLPSFNPNS